MKVANSLTALLLTLGTGKHASADDSVFVCSVCGLGNVTDFTAVVDLPSIPNATCGQLVFSSESGGIGEAECAIVQSVAEESCGCQASGVDPQPGGDTVTPESGPGPEGCVSDLDELAGMELDADVSVPREVVLCPDTEYIFGKLTDDGTVANGFSSFSPQSNLHLKCGKNGSSSNNCVFLDGDFIFVFFTETTVNVTIQGVTIEAAGRGASLFVGPGDITFVDCVFRVSCG